MEDIDKLFGSQEDSNKLFEEMINEDTSKGSRYPSTQKYGGNYELVHPDSETVYAAVYLWHHFGEEPDFRAMLDDLYERTLPLLDAVANFLSPASSLNGLERLTKPNKRG